jgi:hypothetical protein
LGSKLLWTVGPNYFEAIRRYYRGLLKAGAIQKKVNSVRKNKVALASSFDTWGAQCARQEHPDYFNENTLNDIYEGLIASGIKVDNFVVDGFWEEKYGDLRHDPKRFPILMKRKRIRGWSLRRFMVSLYAFRGSAELAD